MIWTKEKPTAPGWYWWRSPDGLLKYPIHIIQTDRWLELEEDGYSVDELQGEFAGPMPEPQEPQ